MRRFDCTRSFRAPATGQGVDPPDRADAGRQRSLISVLEHISFALKFYLQWTFHDRERQRSSIFVCRDFSLPWSVFCLGFLGEARRHRLQHCDFVRDARCSIAPGQ
jgi:hypothetical protein